MIDYLRAKLINMGIKTSGLTKRQILESYRVEPAAPKNKVGRNDPCPCGSAIKYKRCCLTTHTK